MNISGITQTAQVLPESQSAPPPPEARSVDEATAVSAETANLSTQVSVEVMDMAQRQFEQAANELISTMAASTGVGANVDVSV